MRNRIYELTFEVTNLVADSLSSGFFNAPNIPKIRGNKEIRVTIKKLIEDSTIKDNAKK